MDLKYEDVLEVRKQLKGSGVTTESQNRLPIFEPTLRPKYGRRVFENKYGKLLVEGRLGQAHKNLLETIFWKKELYSFSEVEGRKHLKVLYDEETVRRYMSQNSKYNYETYKTLLKDMIQTYISLETNKLKIEGTLIMQVEKAKVLRPAKSKSPIIPGEVPLTLIIFGAVATALFENELRFTYDPKPVLSLRSGISQALVRFLKTQKEHPASGYNLKTLLENLEGQMGNKKWWEIRRCLKEDTGLLEKLGIVIDFKEDRIIVVESHKRQ